ncbi:MAG: hypothetical protein QM820_54285 [Minicystis sp.]
MVPPGFRSGLGVAALSLSLVIAGRAAAQEKPTLSGSWTASALSESWSVSDWGEACGPKPAGRGAGGGSVQIREQGGELSIIGAGRAFSTAECWEQMPGLARTSHSSSGGGRFWRTRCTSPANDPRRAVVTTSISATDSSIQLNETGEYQFIIKDTTCRASVTRSRSFSLVRRDGDTPPAPTASASASAAPAASTAAPAPPPPKEPEPKPSSRCSGSSGEPAKLEVHPGKKLLRAGDRFTFRAVVTDAEGCPTGTRPTWSILPGPLAGKASVDASGTVAIAADAGEGKLEVSASVGGKGVTVPVEVASPDHYDALLGASGLNDAGEADQAAVAVIAVGTIGGRTTVAEDAARERKFRFVAIVGAVATMLGFAGLVIMRRGRRPVEEVEPDPPPSHGEEPPPDDASPVNAPAAAPSPARRPGRGKICPTCGERYPNEAEFCGKDATKLVLLNY